MRNIIKLKRLAPSQDYCQAPSAIDLMFSGDNLFLSVSRLARWTPSTKLRRNNAKKANTRSRYLYVKCNNAVAELTRIESEKFQNLDGGPEAYLQHFVDFTEGHPTLVVSAHDVPAKDVILEKKCVKAISYYWPSPVTVANLFDRVLVGLRMFRTSLAFRPTHVYCWQLNMPLWSTYLVARLYRCRFVTSVHSSLQSNGTRPINRLRALIDNWIFRHADAVICHGPYVRDELCIVGVKKQRIIEFNWGYKHLRTSDNSSKLLPSLCDKKIVLFVGRLIEAKGILLLLDAMTPILRSQNDVVLCYAGDGHARKGLEAEVASRGFAEEVLVLGRKNQMELARLITQSWTVVTPTLTSLSEGRCMAALEAIVLGIPVVAPDFGAFRYVVTSKVNGLLYEPDSTKDLTRALEAILADRVLYDTLKDGTLRTRSALTDSKFSFRDAIDQAFK